MLILATTPKGYINFVINCSKLLILEHKRRFYDGLDKISRQVATTWLLPCGFHFTIIFGTWDGSRERKLIEGELGKGAGQGRVEYERARAW